jgi:hypothetical protein
LASQSTGDIYRRIEGRLGPDGAAQTLNDAGIPGIKYLDAGSRNAGDGTRNYVVFDPGNINVLKRYGIAATALGGAGGMVAQQPEQPSPSN